MATTGIGFNQTVDYKGWAVAIPNMDGATYGVQSGWAVTKSATNVVNQVDISAGSGFGWGVFITSDAASVTLPSTPGWYLVGWRIAWTDQGGTVTSGYIAVDETAALPAEMPGDSAFLPLAHCLMVAGNGAPLTITDRRLWSTQVIGTSALANVYRPQPRQIAVVGNLIYQWLNGSWTKIGGQFGTTQLWVGTSPGFVEGYRLSTSQWLFPTWTVVNKDQGNITFPQSKSMLTIPPGTWSVRCYVGATGGAVDWRLYLDVDAPPELVATAPPKQPLHIAPIGAAVDLSVKGSHQIAIGLSASGSAATLSLTSAKLTFTRLGDYYG